MFSLYNEHRIFTLWVRNPKPTLRFSVFTIISNEISLKFENHHETNVVDVAALAMYNESFWIEYDFLNFLRTLQSIVDMDCWSLALITPTGIVLFSSIGSNDMCSSCWILA